jgi:Domain of unknown function (DUF4372)/Transposase DDE domain
MRHHHSVLHGLLKHVPWAAFDRLVAEHETDRRVRRLTTRSQLVALLYGQLAGAVSLREIETALSSHQSRLYHLGVREVSRSTLADANANRPAAVFTGLFAQMVGQAQRGLRRRIGEAVRLIDSTGLRLAGRGTQWAAFAAGVCGAKVHVVYDPDAEQPLYAAVTPAKVNDITAAQAMPIEAGATYLFDLGYYDDACPPMPADIGPFGDGAGACCAGWARLDAAGCRIVTRFKRNTPLHRVTELPVVPGSAILSDRIGHLPARQAKNRKNPFDDPVREVRVRSETGKILRILSNDLDASAEAIAELYKRRWQIELFFRWVKQTLRIKHFIGLSENAVRIQIAVALIAYLLLRLAKDTAKTMHGPLAFARLIRATLMHRRPLDRLLQAVPLGEIDQRQIAMQLAST